MVKNNVIVTVVGKNRAGVLSEVTTAIANLGGNIMDISQKMLSGYFNLIMIVEMLKVKIGLIDFKKKLEELGDKKGYKISVQHEKVFHYMHRI
ncbi:MAG: ACT domain-containing protein [bacterium (Candidatus Ratteibacteria) CG_4_10_14_3_um_filter_41_18]|uniref:ACT domain-containing protein n=4 Tax=Candidatus Ratteibacteria TaxID=2979319 RepID=A0A2M7EAP9_9BACT|nr:MAG: ACT domain-containing protein [bacterium (Candidatus Ratteibacteria) CG01_land_8_20_14_3_00_40_19]PIW34119.1 MAG: ACT domain-containing protein [bacterium (Candidatus Ratteibacteria) CG15_BIG_FIL_POST_REV_8_21_14_020_41_12]PIX76888.1 MAG: ACT domain-containing protein [bacterium (Candidatus Ratteibacteria) CG_4_10_14_3_um_filter_41_18]PJA61146.1 MAG: ACT domain-containing protein [bacterium (Candidatus Ratteibacteria) CG_4_9_14_3_um_filter_41_21]HCG77087.1 ACT domain-containing protein 